MPLSPVPAESSLAFLDHLERESRRFREVLADAPAGATVPTCPDWDTDDLIWHLAEVQWFWGEIAERRLTDPADLDELNLARRERPADRAGLLASYDRSSRRLREQLADLDPATPLYMWAEDKTAGYIRRRQAHEALVHRVDAELAAGAERAPIDCALAADGVDEVLRVMRGYEDEPGLTDEPASGPVVIATVDAMHSWTVQPVRVTGTYDGRDVDLLRFRVSDGPGATAVAEITGTAADLDCWLWNRPVVGDIERQGDPLALSAVDGVLTSSID